MLEHKQKQNVITYECDRLIKIFDISKKSKVAYIIHTLLQIINRYDEIEVHILTKDKKGEKT